MCESLMKYSLNNEAISSIFNCIGIMLKKKQSLWISSGRSRINLNEIRLYRRTT